MVKYYLTTMYSQVTEIWVRDKVIIVMYVYMEYLCSYLSHQNSYQFGIAEVIMDSLRVEFIYRLCFA